MKKKNIPAEFVFQLFALIIAIIVVHAFYVSVVRPNAAEVIEQQTLAAQENPDYVRDRSTWVLVKDFEQEACFILMIWALAIMGYKARLILSERRLLEVDLVPIAEGMRILPEDTREFARQVGFPLIIKPPAGAGASGTWKVRNEQELERVIQDSGLADGVEVAIEEFIQGHEGYLDTLCINGEVAHEFITHYYPNVLTAMRERWISPQMVTTNRIEAEGYLEVRQMARDVIRVLDIGTSATHMEWFAGPKGLKFSEIGCRPPGVGQWDVYNAANEFDLYREWGTAMVHGRPHGKPSRRYAAGMIALRPSQDGRITGYSGLQAIEREFGNCVVASHLPAVGSPTQPVEGGYMANAWMRVRHPDYDTLRQILDTIGETVQVHAD